MKVLQRHHVLGLILAASVLSGCGVPANAPSSGSASTDSVHAQSLNKISFTTMYFEDSGYVFATTHVKRMLGHDIRNDIVQVVVGGTRKFASRLVLGNDHGLYVVQGDPIQLPSNPTHPESHFYRVGTWSGPVATKHGTGTEGIEITFASDFVLKYKAGFGGLDTVFLETPSWPSAAAAPKLYLPQ